MISRLQNIYQILKEHIFPWWRSKEKRVAWGGLITLLLLSIASVYIAVIFNYWQRNFFNAIEKKDLSSFSHQGLIFIFLLIAILFNESFKNYLSAWLSFRWRRWSTEQLQDKWLSHKNFYKIPLKSQELDNPDQRIAQDIKEVCNTSTNIFIPYFHNAINFITFTTILWNLSKSFIIKIGGFQLHISGLLVSAAIFYSLIGTIVTCKIGYSLIDLDRTQEKREANFRYRLMRVFERREEIAILNGEYIEQQGLLESFTDLGANYYEILKQEFYINLSKNFYIQTAIFVPLLIVGPLYVKAMITMGVLMQMRGIFIEVNSSLSAIVWNFQLIASALASLRRLIHFKSMIVVPTNTPISLPIAAEKLHIPPIIIRTPDHEKIWTSPEIILKPGDRKLLMAPSRTGKSSLLRVIAGIYPHIEGSGISLDHTAMIIPQRPYMPLGTLRECICYPSYKNIDNNNITNFMEKLNLDHLIKLLDKTYDYQNRLSLGEQQRINFIRALLYQPKWLFMDEPIAHLHHESSAAIFDLLTTTLPSTGIFIVSHQEIEGFEKIDLKQSS